MATSRARRALTGGVLVVLLAGIGGGIWHLRQRPLFPAGTRVLLVTVDTLRPDAVGFVAHRNETPVIDALARDGVRFAAAISSVPLTLPSHTTMMTGLQPVRHGVHVNGQALSAQIPTLAEQFHVHGYATAAFVGATVLQRKFGLDRGFDVYDDASELHDDRLMQRRAAQTIAKAADWIAAQGDRPWFLWVHLYDAHTPYDPPREFWQPGGERALYDGAVTYVDTALSHLFDAAHASAGDALLTVLTADHGEAFGEKGEVEHGVFIYDTTVRVPLVVHYPAVLKPAAPAFTPRLVDLTPTLVGGLGWTMPIEVDGVDLGPGLRGGDLRVPTAYVESEYPWTGFGWAPLHGIVDAGWKLIDAPRPELYDLLKDPGENDDRHATETSRFDHLTILVDRERAHPPLAEAAQVDDSETLSRLQSLGYVGAGNAIGPAPDGRPDPKDRTELRKQLRVAEWASHEKKMDQARGLFERILDEEPDNRFALARLASLTLNAGDLDASIGYARRALAVSNEQADMHFALADALTRARRYDEALPHWMEAARLMPTRVEAWSNLGSTALWSGATERALVAYRTALELAPDDAAVVGNLAEAERQAGQFESAAEHLIAAARFEGAGTHRAARIGLVLARLGRDDEARDWLQRAKADDDDFAESRLRLAAYMADTDPAQAGEQVRQACQLDVALRTRVASDPRLAAFVSQCAPTR